MTISLHGLSKSYIGHGRRVDAIVEIDLQLEAGELLVVVGPSGSGKSTLLRCVAGLEEVDQGTVHVGGRDVTRSAPGNRDVAMVFQEHALYPHLDVRTNLAFPLMARKSPKHEIEDRVKRTSEALDLVPFLDRRPGELSGGERRRVALGRAVVRDPSAFLMDEPLVNLDVTLKLRVLEEIRSLQRRLQTTTLYVTHDQTEALALGDRIAVMRDGRLEQVGSPTHIHDRPANTFVASFVGRLPMNLIPGDLLNESVPTIGIRPEHVRIVEAGSGKVDGTVSANGLLGTDALVDIDVGGNTVRALSPRTTSPSLGMRVGLELESAGILRFDAAGDTCS